MVSFRVPVTGGMRTSGSWVKFPRNHFDEIIIRCDKNLRGRTADEIIGLLKEGIEKVNPNIPTVVIPNENEALEYIYANQKTGCAVYYYV